MDAVINAEVAVTAGDVLWLSWLAAYLVVCLIFWWWAVKQEEGMPPAVCRRDGFGWQRGDVLASARDWWRWQFYAALVYAGHTAALGAVLFWDIAPESAAIDVGLSLFDTLTFLFALGVFLYFGIQRFMAAGKNLWIFVLVVLVLTLGSSLVAVVMVSIFGPISTWPVVEDSGGQAWAWDLIVVSAFAYAAHISIIAYIGTLPDKESRAELTGDTIGDNKAAA